MTTFNKEDIAVNIVKDTRFQDFFDEVVATKIDHKLFAIKVIFAAAVYDFTPATFNEIMNEGKISNFTNIVSVLFKDSFRYVSQFYESNLHPTIMLGILMKEYYDNGFINQDSLNNIFSFTNDALAARAESFMAAVK